MKLIPDNKKASAEFRGRILKLQTTLRNADAQAPRVGLILAALPPLYDAALSDSLPATLKAGAKLIRAMAQAGLATPTEKAQANAYLTEPPA